MLKALSLVTAFGVMLSALGIFLSISVGRLQSPNSLVLLIEGIIICHVQRCEANQQVHESVSNLLSNIGDSKSGTIYLNDYSVYYWRSLRSEELNIKIRDFSDQAKLRLGDLISVHNMPCGITITENDIFIQFSKIFVTIESTHNLNRQGTLSATISPNSVIEEVHIYSDPIPCSTRLTFPTSYNITSLWKGLKTIYFYIEDSTNG